MRSSPWKSVQILAPSAEEICARVLQPLAWICHRGWGWFASCSGLGRLSYGAAQDQRCHADLVSMLENLCAYWKLGLQLGVFRLGGVFLNIKPPVDVSFCRKPWAVPAPMDLSA